MKKSIATITAAAILGLALGLFAGCANILDSPPSGLLADGTGRVLINLGPQAEGARTLMPAVDYNNFSYTYTFASEGKSPVSGAITRGTAEVVLGAGTWTLTVEGKQSNTLVLKGTVEDIAVRPGESERVNVRMKGFMESWAGNGMLSYSVTFPSDVSRGTLTVYGGENDAKVDSRDLAAGTDPKTVNGRFDLPAGYYRVALDLYKANGVLSQTDIAHIYPKLTTEAPYTINAADFTPATVDNTRTTLTEVLGSIRGLAGRNNITYLLSAGSETMDRVSVSNTNPVTVTIDGGGREVTLGASGGSLITVEENVTLVLKNITLKGRGENSNNSAALIWVATGGTLELGSNVLITGNRNSSSYGGGVYVDKGGIFAMSGGEISGNTASSSSSYSYGGGVSVDKGGTFTMSGGEISGNTASSSSASGGGVHIVGGTFTMSGGEISGNTASYGGGVSVGGGTFAMSGGEISGNTANSYGGGVSVANGTFTKESAGIIYGSDAGDTLKNTARDNSSGHAVHIVSSGKKRNTTAGEGVTMDSSLDGAAGGWEE